MSEELAVLERDQSGAIQLLLNLESEGRADAVSLRLDEIDLPYERWEALGRFLGNLDRRSRWYIGDWINHGEAIYGEDFAQGIDATTSDRYSTVERVTGLEHGSLLNIASICGRVARDRRREELGFWIHAEVAPLEAAEQTEWLQRAIDEAWTRADLRDAIRAVKNPAPPPVEEAVPPPVDELSVAEKIEMAARRVYHQGQPTDGGVIVPVEAWAGLRAALGEE